tara:strand:+ start:154 stop:381 length:228 start_codon:yes stop_codon:yes gene_type:complete
MKKTILILASDPFSINYEIIKKSQNFLKKKQLKNKYLIIGDQKEIRNYIGENNKLINYLNIKRKKKYKAIFEGMF